ncbi:baseplate J/gp47 family protein [Flavobacterium sp. RHBU_3]|uniref:baseplate J/gp47 family protein n=1 Tax=Flavobacterium sp. RHBU_3 TaxID=3391184 RepID=UPI0039853A88
MKKTDTFSHYRDGKSQMQRFLTELNPGSLELHDFDLFDWLLFANNFAKHVNYFDKNDATTPNGSWEGFFLGDDDYSIPRRESVEYKSLKKQVTDLVNQYEEDGSLTPHLTLFICFIKLLDFSKKEFNNLTKRHLDFYYNEILQIEKQEATPDKAYVIFELAKKAVQEKIPEGTLLNAQKDINGKQLIFKTNKELIASQAKVAELKTLLNDAENKELKMARVANTLDGISEKLPDAGNYWWPFGYNSDETDNSDFKELENAKLGFSIASSLFNLKEGERTVTVTISFKENSSTKLEKFSTTDIQNNIKLLCSGEKEWLSGAAIKCTENSSSKLQLTFTLLKDFPAIANYNKAVLAESFNTDLPVVRFIIDGVKYYDVYTALSEKEIKNVDINIDVKGVKSVSIENDNGALNAEKAYYPFTAQPITGSNFFMKYPEMFAKKWDSASFTINWKNTPQSITDLYKAYILSPNQDITKSDFDKAPNTSVVTDDTYFKANAALFEKKEWSLKSTGIQLFQKNGNSYQTTFTVNNTSHSANTSEAIRLTLQQSALQDVYPKLYTLAITSTKDTVLIPNEPYIPVAEDIELNYSASGSVYTIMSSAGKGKSVKNEGVQLFHEDAFGQYEKEVATKSVVPVHTEGGELYVGIEAANENETVSLLIQVLEGSENPLAETFEDNENIEWSILSNDSWIDLSDYIITNETKRFLESGILKFKVPNNIGTNNTSLTTGLIWLRAVTKRSYDAVCKMQGVYTQAVLSTFQDNDNDLSHLDTGLEAGTISKLITRVPQVKSVTQPYNSFDGKYKESDTAFYRRVSERLRHKNRAITLWDYEQLILQQFPDVFMAKCLNHTSENSYLAPGYITLVVVPNIKNKNAFDIYQPRVSRATLNKIQDYVNGLNSMHVTAQVINPDYKEARINIKAKFFDEYDDAFYSKQLDEDIKKYISPWAFGDFEAVSFNSKLNVNQLTNYLEQLYYVDYIDELKVYVNNVLQKQYLIEAEPKSILVSAKQHVVKIAEQVCI